jgi:hypothetical protein
MNFKKGRRSIMMDATKINAAQLEPYYNDLKIRADRCADNLFYCRLWESLQKSFKMPVLGVQGTGMQIPINQLSPFTPKFPNLGVEMAFYQQYKLSRIGRELSPDYYQRHTSELDALYLLNTSVSMVIRGVGQPQRMRTCNLEVIRQSIPIEMVENKSKQRQYDYLNVDVRPDLEKATLRSIELRPTDTGKFRLYCMQTPVKGTVMVPCYIMSAFISKLINILNRFVVTIRYKDEQGSIVSMITSLRQDYLTKYFGNDARLIHDRCQNAVNPMELTLAVIPENMSAVKIATLNVMGICSVAKVQIG